MHFLDWRQLQKQSLKIHPSYQQSVRSMLDGRWETRDLTRKAVINRNVGQVLQSCLADKWDQFFPAVPGEEVWDVPLGCRITSNRLIRNFVLGFSRCHLPSASLQQSCSHSPSEGLVCSLFLHTVQIPKCEWCSQPLSYLWYLQLQQLANVDVMTSQVSFLPRSFFIIPQLYFWQRLTIFFFPLELSSLAFNWKIVSGSPLLHPLCYFSSP